MLEVVQQAQGAEGVGAVFEGDGDLEGGGVADGAGQVGVEGGQLRQEGGEGGVGRRGIATGGVGILQPVDRVVGVVHLAGERRGGGGGGRPLRGLLRRGHRVRGNAGGGGSNGRYSRYAQ